MLNDRIKRNFLEAIRDGRVTEHEDPRNREHITARLAFEDRRLENVDPLISWARDQELIVDGWHPQHRDDWHVVSLNTAGERALAELNLALRGHR